MSFIATVDLIVIQRQRGMQYTIPLYPNHCISIQLFSHVKNAATILAAIKSPDPAFKHCFLDTRLIVSVEQILFAALRAIRDEQDGQLRTKTVHSEIVYSLSPNQNITEALKKFGIADDSTSLLCVAINEIADASLIDGDEEQVDDETVLKYCDVQLLRKMYKIDKGITDINELEAQVIGSIALRGSL